MVEYKYWIALENSKGIGLAGLTEIYNTITSLNISLFDIFSLNEEELRGEFVFNDKIFAGILEAQSNLEIMEEPYFDIIEAGIRTVMFFESDYPEKIKTSLKNLAPPILYFLGNNKLLNMPSSALLGQSDISPVGEAAAYLCAKELVRHNICVLSGLTKKIGVTVHRSAVENAGSTIGILPSGFLKFKMSDRLKEVFLNDRFLLLSCFNPLADFSSFNAIIRNRLICALADTVFILEAPAEEGIFEAAKSATKLQKPLFTLKYEKFPETAKENPKLISDYGAFPIDIKKDGNISAAGIESIVSKTLAVSNRF